MKRFTTVLCLVAALCAMCLIGCGESRETPPEAPPPIELTELTRVYCGRAIYPTVTLTPTDLSDVTLRFYSGEEEIPEAVYPGKYRVKAVAENGAAQTEAELVILPVTVDPASVVLPPKKFDGTTDYVISTRQLPGKVRGDALFLEIEAKFSDAAAGARKRLTVYSIRLTGAAAGYYKLSKAAELYADIIA